MVDSYVLVSKYDRCGLRVGGEVAERGHLSVVMLSVISYYYTMYGESTATHSWAVSVSIIYRGLDLWSLTFGDLRACGCSALINFVYGAVWSSVYYLYYSSL